MSDENPDSELVSKTQRKKEAHALQELGQELTNLESAQLLKLPVTDAVRQAIGEYNRLPKSFGARKRQLQFIGKLMRDCDLEEIRHAMALIELRKSKRAKSPGETISQDIVLRGDDAINDTMRINPNLDRQKLRRLYREFQRSSEDSQSTAVSKLKSYLDEELLK